jgi:hypothetical protein
MIKIKFDNMAKFILKNKDKGVIDRLVKFYVKLFNDNPDLQEFSADDLKVERAA